MTTANIFQQQPAITRDERERVLGQRGYVVWLTGLSGSGKSTIGHACEAELLRRGRWAYVLDGDNVRHGLNSDLRFSPADRAENVRRLGEVAALFCDAGAIVLVSAISPFRSDRARARERAGERFLEVFVDAPLAVCEERDVKGLYAKARAGEIPEFTGISAPYEAPEQPELVVRTAGASVDDAVSRIVALLAERGAFALSAAAGQSTP